MLYPFSCNNEPTIVLGGVRKPSCDNPFSLFLSLLPPLFPFFPCSSYFSSSLSIPFLNPSSAKIASNK